MSPSEKFVRLADECRVMAEITHTPESKTVWIRMAERWLRCAELHDRQTAAARDHNSAKRHRAAAQRFASVARDVENNPV